jgi:hypothetical protein
MARDVLSLVPVSGRSGALVDVGRRPEQIDGPQRWSLGHEAVGMTRHRA